MGSQCLRYETCVDQYFDFRAVPARWDGGDIAPCANSQLTVGKAEGGQGALCVAEGVDEGCTTDQAMLPGGEPEEDALIVGELPGQGRQSKRLALESRRPGRPRCPGAGRSDLRRPDAPEGQLRPLYR